jgi:hypothetical protein
VDTNSLSLYATRLEALQRLNTDGYAMRTATVPTQAAILQLPQPGVALSAAGPYSIIGSGDRIAIQTQDYRILRVISPLANATYPVGSVIPIIVVFSVAVTVDPAPNGIVGKQNCAAVTILQLVYILICAVLITMFKHDAACTCITYC